MSRQSLGEQITCDICREQVDRIPKPVELMVDYCSISGNQRGVSVGFRAFGYGGPVDICIDCRLESLKKTIWTYERMKNE